MTDTPQPADGLADSEEPSGALTEPVLVPPRGLVATVLVALLATASVAILWPGELTPSSRPSLALDTWPLGAAEAEAVERSRTALLDSSSRPAVAVSEQQAIISGLHHYLVRERDLGIAAIGNDAEARTTLGGLEERVRNLVLRHGNEALRALAVAYGRDVAMALQQTLRAVVKDGQDFGLLVAGQPSHGALAAIERVAPGSTRTFARLGIGRFFDGRRLQPSARLMVEAMAEQRLLSLGQRLPPPVPELSTELRHLLLRFRVEAYEGLALSRKLELIEVLREQTPSYPSTYVTAVLLAREGRMRAARGQFLLAAERGQFPRLARSNARWCRKRRQERPLSDARPRP